MILRARFIVPVDQPIIEDGAVEIIDGVITGVGSSKNFQRSGALDYGDAVICPGFVNAHTHLELSHLAGLVPPSPEFTDWLRRLVACLTDPTMTQEAVQAAVRAGIEQSMSHGVTAIADITRQPAWTREVLFTAPIHAVSFGEVIAIGGRSSLLDKRLDAATTPEPRAPALYAKRQGSARATPHRSKPLRIIGISPHSPYTCGPETLVACANRARQLQLPMAIHLLETPDEANFTMHAEGPLTEYLRSLGVWDDRIPASGCGPVELLERTGVLTPRTLLAHVNYPNDDDIARIARSGASVAYCPRTHHAFGHAPHRFRDMLCTGINVCIGTDSLASNPSLSVLDELRFLHERNPDVPPDELLAMGTLRGAKALDLDDRGGSITPGKLGDVVVVPVDTQPLNPTWASILESTSDVIATYVVGDRCPTVG